MIVAVDAVSPNVTLADAVRTVARGRDIENQLQRLAGQALALSGAASAAIYPARPVARQLVPAATAGAATTPAAQAPVVAMDDDSQLIARVVRERRPGRAGRGRLDGRPAADRR